MSRASKKKRLVQREEINYSINGLRQAIRSSNFETFEKITNMLAEKPYDFKSYADSDGRNLLLLACIQDKVDKRVLTRLINLGISPFHKSNEVCSLDAIADKVEKQRHLVGLKAVFSDDDWKIWQDAKDAQSRAEYEEAKTIGQAKADEIEQEEKL